MQLYCHLHYDFVEIFSVLLTYVCWAAAKNVKVKTSKIHKAKNQTTKANSLKRPYAMLLV